MKRDWAGGEGNGSVCKGLLLVTLKWCYISSLAFRNCLLVQCRCFSNRSYQSALRTKCNEKEYSLTDFLLYVQPRFSLLQKACVFPGKLGSISSSVKKLPLQAKITLQSPVLFVAGDEYKLLPLLTCSFCGWRANWMFVVCQGREGSAHSQNTSLILYLLPSCSPAAVVLGMWGLTTLLLHSAPIAVTWGFSVRLQLPAWCVRCCSPGLSCQRACATPTAIKMTWL